jgi:uncharacterized protein (TIGR00251 family)
MMESSLHIRETPTGLEIRIHVLPRAKRCEISGAHNGALKVKVTAPPVDDAANRAIIEFFSRLLRVPKSSLTILAGLKSKDKILHIKGLTPSGFFEHLDVK